MAEGLQLDDKTGEMPVLKFVQDAVEAGIGSGVTSIGEQEVRFGSGAAWEGGVCPSPLLSSLTVSELSIHIRSVNPNVIWGPKGLGTKVKYLQVFTAKLGHMKTQYSLPVPLVT